MSEGTCPNSIRLNKYLAKSGLCSRRKADQMIFDGQISINGAIIREPGVQVLPTDKVCYNENPVKPAEEFDYVIIYKPVQVVTSMKDPENRKTVFDILPNDLKKLRLFPVGRLDYFSEGLLLMTNDGELANRLMHPRFMHEKTYLVTIRGKGTTAKLNLIRKGMSLKDGTKFLPIIVQVISENGDETVLKMTLREGKNRQIRRICEELNWTILKLVRISQASLSLGNLKPGQWRKLSPREIRDLKSFP